MLRHLPARGCSWYERDVFELAAGYDETLRFSENTNLGLRLTEATVLMGLALRAVDDVIISVYQPASGSSQAFTVERRHQ